LNSYVALVYGIVRGVTQFVSGFFSDEFGRRDIIVFGLTLDAIALIIVAFTGQFVEGFDANYGIFLFCAALNGLGTGSSYPSLLAAVIDHTDESYKAAALGSYRFWRDLGYAIGAIVSAAIADSIGIPKSVGITGGLIALAAITVAFFYEERRTDGVTVAIPMENNEIFTESQFDKKDKIPNPSSEKGGLIN
jgi:MFS family permease